MLSVCSLLLIVFLPCPVLICPACSGSCSRSSSRPASWWYAAQLAWAARNGEEPAEENEVSERGFKLTLAVVGFAAAVG